MGMRMAGREKTLYSIYRKMEEKHLSFAQVTDIYGFRLIVPNVLACYTGLGLLHQMYKPLPGKFKDHIAIAKLNGYQSLHTTLVGPSGVNVEFQLRTEAMHVVAESGVAAHWLYKAAEPAAAGGRPPWREMAAVAAGHPGRDPGRDGVLGPRKGRPVPGCRLRFYAAQRDHGDAARRHGGRLCLRNPHQHRRPHFRGAHQRRAGSVAYGTEERRRGGSRHRPGIDAQPGLARLRADRTRALQDSPLPQDAGPDRIRRTRRKTAVAGAARRGSGQPSRRPVRVPTALGAPAADSPATEAAASC